MKKYNTILKRVALLLGAGVFITSCEKFSEGVSDQDPTLPTDASIGQVINVAEVSYIGYMEGELARTAGMWGSTFTGTDRQYVSLNNYISTAPDYDNAWSNIYAGVIKNLRIAEKKAASVNNKRALALAQILEAHTIGTTAALFGDVPFTQAANLTEFPNPAYDGQRAVYTGVLALLDQAITNIENALPGTNYDGDFFFDGGDDATWTMVANTLKAKFHLHLGEYQKAFDAASNGITDPAFDMNAKHGDSYLLDFNVYYSFGVYDRAGYIGANDAYAPRLIDPTNSDAAYSKNNDKTDESDRFSFVYWGSLEDGYDLNYSGYDYDDGNPDGFFSNRASFPLLTYRENQLILAETTLRLQGAAAALDVLNEYRQYLDGGGYINPEYYTGAGKYQDFDLADFNPGGFENADGIAAADALYREIVEEKYVSLIGTLELFIDLHRKGTGAFASQQNWKTIGIAPNQGTNIPQRFLYAQSEINSNTSTPSPIPGLFDASELFK